MPRETNVRAAALQIGPVDGDAEATVQKCEAWLDRAADAGVRLAVLPEAIVPGVAGFVRAHAEGTEHALAEAVEALEPLGGSWTQRIAARARRHRMVVAAGLLLRGETTRPINVSVLFGEHGRIVSVHRKAHLTPEVEAPYMDPGDRFEAHDTSVGRLAHPVCADLSLPETSRILAIKGAQNICGSLAVFYDGPADGPQWIRQMYLHSHASPTRAIDNGVFVVACNQSGASGGIEFFGRSRIIDPNGDILAEGGEGVGVEELVVADLDLERGNKLPWSLIDRRRPELYADVLTPNPLAGNVRWRRAEPSGSRGVGSADGRKP